MNTTKNNKSTKPSSHSLCLMTPYQTCKTNLQNIHHTSPRHRTSMACSGILIAPFLLLAKQRQRKTSPQAQQPTKCRREPRASFVFPSQRKVNSFDADDVAIGELQSDGHRDIMAVATPDDMHKRVHSSGISQALQAARNALDCQKNEFQKKNAARIDVFCSCFFLLNAVDMHGTSISCSKEEKTSGSQFNFCCIFFSRRMPNNNEANRNHSNPCCLFCTASQRRTPIFP